MARLNRAAPEFVSFQENGDVIGLAAVRVKRLSALPFGVAYVLHGPMTMRSGPFSAARYAACLDALVRHYVKQRKVSLRVVPPLAASVSADETMQALAEAGFERLDRAPNKTILLAVDRSLSHIRKGLESRWRNKLNQAERAPLEIVDASEPENFPIMDPMLRELEDKKQFRAGHDVSFFEAVQRIAAPFERLTLHLGKFEGRVVSAHLSSFAGNMAVSLLAATNEEGRRLKVSHRMQWRMVEDAVKAGKRWYDLGGVDAEENPGVYSFKKGMNGIEIAELGVFERAPNALASRAILLAERLYRASRR